MIPLFTKQCKIKDNDKNINGNKDDKDIEGNEDMNADDKDTDDNANDSTGVINEDEDDKDIEGNEDMNADDKDTNDNANDSVGAINEDDEDDYKLDPNYEDTDYETIKAIIKEIESTNAQIPKEKQLSHISITKVHCSFLCCLLI